MNDFRVYDFQLLLQNSWLALLLTAIAAYLLGSISFAIIVTRLFSKKDIRDFGSGNAGATNVLRSQGKLPALITAVGDIGKSVAAVFLGGYLMTAVQFEYLWINISSVSPAHDTEVLRLFGYYVAGLFSILGHMFPVFFGFRGGKGVATTFGMMLFLDWRVALVLLVVFLIVILTTRMVSLGSVLAAVSFPISTWIFRTYLDHQSPPLVWFCTVVTALIAAIVIFRHRANIKRIIQGTESKI